MVRGSVWRIRTSPEFGKVLLDKEGVKDDLGHKMNRVKACAFAAVHDVIERGIAYNRSSNWKDCGWGSAVIGAPIKIGEKNYICEVVIKRMPNRQGFYLHDVDLKEKVEAALKTSTEGRATPISKCIIAKLYDECLSEHCSKVVDENGEPLVVYHGTPHSGFTVFNGKKKWDGVIGNPG